MDCLLSVCMTAVLSVCVTGCGIANTAANSIHRQTTV